MCKTAVQLSTALEKLLGWPRQTGSDPVLSGDWIPAHAEVKMTVKPSRHIAILFEGRATVWRRDVLLLFLTTLPYISNRSEPHLLERP